MKMKRCIGSALDLPIPGGGLPVLKARLVSTEQIDLWIYGIALKLVEFVYGK